MYDIDDQGVDRVVSAAPCMVGGGKERAFLFDQGLAVWRVSPNPATRAPKRLPVVRKEFGGNGPGTFLANTGFKVLANVAQTRDEDTPRRLAVVREEVLGGEVALGYLWIMLGSRCWTDIEHSANLPEVGTTQAAARIKGQICPLNQYQTPMPQLSSTYHPTTSRMASCLARGASRRNARLGTRRCNV